MSSLNTICKKGANIFIGIKDLHQLPGCIGIFGVYVDSIAESLIRVGLCPGTDNLGTDHAGYIVYRVVIKAGNGLVVSDQRLERLCIA